MSLKYLGHKYPPLIILNDKPVGMPDCYDMVLEDLRDYFKLPLLEFNELTEQQIVEYFFVPDIDIKGIDEIISIIHGWSK